MKRHFLVLAKLVGLLQVYWTLANFMQVGFTLSLLGQSSSPHHSQSVVSLIGIATYVVLSFGMAWLLLAQTEWLANILRIQDKIEPEGLCSQPVLLVGVQLIGVFVTVHAIPSLVRALMEVLRYHDEPIGWDTWIKIVPTTLQLGLGLFLALGSRRVVAIVSIREMAEPRPGANR